MGIGVRSGLRLGPTRLILPWVIGTEVPGGSLVGKPSEYVECMDSACQAMECADMIPDCSCSIGQDCSPTMDALGSLGCVRF
jgi:hypothetical protein